MQSPAALPKNTTLESWKKSGFKGLYSYRRYVFNFHIQYYSCVVSHCADWSKILDQAVLAEPEVSKIKAYLGRWPNLHILFYIEPRFTF